MARSILTLAALALFAAGCGDDFPDEEMHLGLETKTRPFAVVVEPPDAAPGDTVTVTFLAWSPDPDEVDVSWRVALDYDSGLYGTDEVERRYVDVAAPLPVADADGFMTQAFRWVVPDSVHLWTSAIPTVLDDPVIVALAEELVGSPPRKDSVDAWLRALTPGEVAAMDPATREATWALADRFACRIRFRARLQSDRTIDVTRNVTVRHTRRLGGPNANLNAEIVTLAVAEVHKEDAKRKDLDDPAVTKSWYRFVDGGVRVADEVQVPVHPERTYYAVVGFAPERYTSPFEYGAFLTEEGSYRWYYHRQDDPGSAHQFFVTEEGDPAEMWDLKEEARLDPAGVGSRFRLVAGVRDERGEWRAYHAAPGLSVVEGVVEFVAP